jgi:hypothetical protein
VDNLKSRRKGAIAGCGWDGKTGGVFFQAFTLVIAPRRRIPTALPSCLDRYDTTGRRVQLEKKEVLREAVLMLQVENRLETFEYVVFCGEQEHLRV